MHRSCCRAPCSHISIAADRRAERRLYRVSSVSPRLCPGGLIIRQTWHSVRAIDQHSNKTNGSLHTHVVFRKAAAYCAHWRVQGLPCIRWMTCSEPASRLVGLLRQLETFCNAHGGTALSRPGSATSMAPMHAQTAFPPGAAMNAGAARRCAHSQTGRGVQGTRTAQEHAAPGLALLACSSRLSGGGAAQRSSSASSSVLRLHTQTTAAANSSSEGGAAQRPASAPSYVAWQQARRNSWAAANAVQPAAVGAPAVQYAPHFQPQARPTQWQRQPLVHPLGVQPPLQQPSAQPLLAVSPPPAAAAWQGIEVAGVVQRVTYRSQETGYCVLKLKVPLRSSTC